MADFAKVNSDRKVDPYTDVLITFRLINLIKLEFSQNSKAEPSHGMVSNFFPL